MLEFGGVIYYLDLQKFEEVIRISGNKKPNDNIVVTEVVEIKDANGNIIKTETKKIITERGREIDVTKYDMIRLMLDVLMELNNETDEELGVDRALSKAPLSHKVAFNTLYNYGILKEAEE